MDPYSVKDPTVRPLPPFSGGVRSEEEIVYSPLRASSLPDVVHGELDPEDGGVLPEEVVMLRQRS